MSDSNDHLWLQGVPQLISLITCYYSYTKAALQNVYSVYLILDSVRHVYMCGVVCHSTITTQPHTT